MLARSVGRSNNLLAIIVTHFFAFSPSSTRRRMASERVILCTTAQSSISAVRSAGSRTALTGSTPPAFLGRPRDFLFTETDFFMFSVYRKYKPEGSSNFAPALTRTTKDSHPMTQDDSVLSTPPLNTSPPDPIAGLDWLDIADDASTADILGAIERLRKEAKDEIERLIRSMGGAA